MNKITLTIMLVLTLILTACGTQGGTTGSPTAEALPASAKLILGTFKLEGTENAVTAEQAAELLPLWQVYQSLTTSDTAAQTEIDALVQQLQETMTSSQVKSIDAMNLTQNDVMTVMTEQNVVEAAPQQSTTTTVNVSGGAPQGDPGGGGMPPADMGAGGDPSMTSGGVAPVTTSSGSTSSTTTQSTGSAGIPSALLDALIQLLQGKAA